MTARVRSPWVSALVHRPAECRVRADSPGTRLSRRVHPTMRRIDLLEDAALQCSVQDLLARGGANITQLRQQHRHPGSAGHHGGAAAFEPRRPTQVKTPSTPPTAIAASEAAPASTAHTARGQARGQVLSSGSLYSVVWSPVPCRASRPWRPSTSRCFRGRLDRA